MRDESHLDQGTKFTLMELRERIVAQGVENARAMHENLRLQVRLDDLIETLEEIAQGHDAREMRQLALDALDDGNGPTGQQISDAMNSAPEPPMHFTDKDTLGRGGLR